MVNLLFRRNWKLLAGLIVVNFVLGKVQQRLKARRNAPSRDTAEKERLTATLEEMADKPGHSGRLVGGSL
jgi:hypothetical protein